MNPTTFFCLLTLTSAQEQSSLKVFTKLYSQCSNSSETFKCLKIQSLKIMEKALHAKSINIIDGVTLVGDRQSRDLLPLDSKKLEKLTETEVNEMLEDTTTRFLNTHKFEVNVPKLVEEARKRRQRGGWGALLGALAIKASFLALGFQGIAIMSGTAILVGKMALLLSAILGLKTLVSSGGEKTTIEIIKVPKYSESHSHSSSYEDDDHHYHRAFDVDDPKINYKLT